MTATILLAAALQAVAPIDWNGLPPLPYRAPPLVTADMNAFVQRQAKASRCRVPPGGSWQIDVAVLIDETGGIRTTVPRAIRCATVEQYAAAAVAGFARNNLLPRSGASSQWYRTRLTFTAR
jgi:hypothetical protein